MTDSGVHGVKRSAVDLMEPPHKLVAAPSDDRDSDSATDSTADDCDAVEPQWYSLAGMGFAKYEATLDGRVRHCVKRRELRPGKRCVEQPLPVVWMQTPRSSGRRSTCRSVSVIRHHVATVAAAGTVTVVPFGRLVERTVVAQRDANTEWRSLVEFGFADYEVSRDGHVRNAKTHFEKRAKRPGYMQLNVDGMWLEGGRRRRMRRIVSTSQLVWWAFQAELSAAQ